MDLEEALRPIWGPLVQADDIQRLYPDVPPDSPTFPLMTFQQVGGREGWYLEKKVPDHRHARIQLNVWAKTRKEANQIAKRAAKALAESELIAEPYGAFVALYDEHQKLYGTRQDFGIWHRDTE